MLCPYCKTENRDDREQCYHCSRDLSMLRLIVNKAKHHYNQALEFAERDRVDDAIHELQNTIDLDASLVNAHVVLGTLYAKKEEFDKARESWKRALALDHRLDKAHEYLSKAETAQLHLPVIRQLRNLSTTLGAIALAALLGWGATALFLLARDEPMVIEQPGPAVAGFVPDLGGDLATGEAWRRLEEQAATAPEEGARALRQLMDQIERQWRRQEDEARLALERDAPAVALELARSLEALEPNEPFLGTARELQEAALARLRTRFEETVTAFNEGRADMAALREAARDAESVFGEGGPERQEIQAALADAERRRQEAMLAEARTVAETAPAPEAVRQLVAWKRDYPSNAEALDALLAQRVGVEARETSASVQALIAEGNLDGAGERIAQFEELAAAAGQPAGVEELREAVAAEGRRAAYEAALAQFQNKDFEAFLEATESPEAIAPGEAERTELERMRSEAARNFASAGWNWFHELDPRFEDGSINEEQARRAVAIYERVIAGLPNHLRYAEGPILYYTARAQHRLGNDEAARALAAQVVERFPRVYVAPSARRFLAQLGGGQQG